jgi:molybdopterin-guanine dinucleotide biosynthesis protein
MKTPLPVQLLSAAEVQTLRIPYAARRVAREDIATLVMPRRAPQAGDVLLARIDEIGQHAQLELAGGRKSRLFVGDRIVLVFGNRYAPDQYEARVPEAIRPCHMVAAGGIAAHMHKRHSRVRGATRITPMGLLGDRNGQTLNLSRYALPVPGAVTALPPVVAVLGTSMNAGKTETATQLIKGLSRAGLRVGAAKVTGTGAGNDTGLMTDAGAVRVLDFGDAGLATTYLADLEAVERCFEMLVHTLARERADVIVLEVADGLYQRETHHLITSEVFRSTVSSVLFAAGDAMGSAAGVAALRVAGLPVRAGSGLVTASPLGLEEAQRAHGLPMLDLEALSSATVAARLGLAPPALDRAA